MNSFFLRIIAMSAAVSFAAWLTDIRTSGPIPIILVGLLLATAQIIVRPALIAASMLAIRRVSLPMLAVFFFAANVFIFWTVGGIVPGFHVEKFSSALGGSIITSIAGFFFHGSLRRKFGIRSGLRSEPIVEPQRDGMKQAKAREIE